MTRELYMALALLASTSAYAGRGRALPESNFTMIRPAAMGEAFTAVADDQNALYYNPAGLARLSTWNLELVTPILGVNSRVNKTLSDVKDLSTSAKDFNNSQAARQSLKSSLVSLGGENQYFRAGLNPTLVMKNFGIGVLLNTEVNLVPHNFSDELVDVYVPIDGDIRFGFASSYLDGALSVGLTLNGRARVVVDEEVGTDRLSDFIGKNSSKEFDDLIRTGAGGGVDIGALYSPLNAPYQPTFGLALLNAGDTSFYKVKSTIKFSSKTPPAIPQSLNLGFSLNPVWGNWIGRAAVDFRNSNLPLPASHKLRLGVEGGWKSRFIRALLQTGLAEGYLTAGCELHVLVFTVRYATYVTEKGYYPKQKPERRHLVNLKILL